MSIEWPKIESGSSKKYKIEGRVLLDLREKTYDLEKQLSAVNMDLEKNNKNLNETKEKKDAADKKIAKLESEIQSVKSDLNDANATNSKLEEQLKKESENASSRYRKIEKLREVLTDKSNNINELNHRIKTLMSELAVGETYQNIQKKIQEVVDYKGFIMDKEIEHIVDKEIEK